MDKKLEQRIARLEKLLSKKSAKNEGRFEYSPEEQTAVDAIIKVKEAIKYAQDCCLAVINADENWTGFDWRGIANDLYDADRLLPNNTLQLDH